MRIEAITIKESWADMVRPLQALVRQLVGILNGGVRLDEQSAGEVKKGVRYIGGETLTVSTKLKTTPAAVLVLSAREALTGSATVISGCAVTWSYANGAISITAITGLTASTDYLVTLWVVEG